MKYVLVILMAFALAGCCRKPITVSSHQRDSICIEYRTQYVEVIRDSIVYVTVPVESHEKNSIRQKRSHLETSIAESDAWICEDGLLNHSIRNKDVTLPATVQIKDTHQSDTCHQTVLREQTQIEVYRERFIPKSYWIFLAATILLVACVVWRIYRA